MTVNYEFLSGMSNLLRRADWLLAAASFMLVGIGLVAVWSFSPPNSGFFNRQVIWALVGLLAFFVFSAIDYRIFKNHGLLLVAVYVAAVALLAVLLFVAPEIRGIKAWFRIGGAGVQPTEPMKLVLALVLAKYFSRRHIEIAILRHLLISGFYAGLAIALVLLQPDLGSSLILAAIWLTVVCFSGIKFRHLAVFFVIAAVFSSLAWFSVLAPYQKARVTSFFDPYRDPKGAGYNIIQSMIAVGSGQFWGKGIGYGTQSHLNFLPEVETDFIFAGFAEETGFAGAMLLLGLFGVLFWRVLAIGLGAQDNFSKLFVLGFAALLFFEAFIHIGMNLGILPVTGIGLPLVSYGGSNLVTTLVGLGILESISINSRAEIG